MEKKEHLKLQLNLELPKALKDMQILVILADMVEENNTSPDFEENVNITNTMDDLINL